MDAAINAAFGELWDIGGVDRLCRYRYRDGTHTIKTTESVATLIEKGTECVNPNALRFEVVHSKQISATTYEHILQPLNVAQKANWTPTR